MTTLNILVEYSVPSGFGNIPAPYSELFMAISVAQKNHPELILAGLEAGESAVFRCRHEQWYLPDSPELELLVAAQADELDRRVMRLVVIEASAQAEQALADMKISNKTLSSESLAALSTAWNVPLINLGQALTLEPVAIPKPWGRELWYTGMEERGLSLVTDGKRSIPLAWLIGILPSRLMGPDIGNHSGLTARGRSPNLLKILDPLPEPVFGDLYFELHEKKREVYVVTHVDKQAWPEGVGGIRYGFSAEYRDRYDDEQAFRSAYLEAVLAYRSVRRQIDALIDDLRIREGVDPDEAVPAEQTKIWTRELPADLIGQEIELRETMNSFTELKPLSLGDVIKVPLLTPHALQHGVRTIEFQTPVYERKILSFTQKVLTQEDWDTADALALMPLPSEQVSSREEESCDLEVLEDSAALKRERIVSFEDFQVQRITLKTPSAWTLSAPGTYALLINIQGILAIQGQGVGLHLGHEQAVFIPACAEGISLRNLSIEPCELLISQAAGGNLRDPVTITPTPV